MLQKKLSITRWTVSFFFPTHLGFNLLMPLSHSLTIRELFKSFPGSFLSTFEHMLAAHISTVFICQRGKSIKLMRYDVQEIILLFLVYSHVKTHLNARELQRAGTFFRGR